MFSFSNKSEKILVVDDMSLSRVSIKRVLVELGFNSVELAENGLTAWEKLATSRQANAPFGLVLSDWMMPELDGLGLFKKLAGSGWSDIPPFILITAESDSFQVGEAIKLGISGYIRKPITLEALEKTLKELNGSPQTGKTP